MLLLDKFVDLKIDLEPVNIAWTSKYDSEETQYDSTPVGAYVFASTGCDGVSFCIMPKDNNGDLDNSPVYTLSPMDFDEGTVVWAAKNIEDFLRFVVLAKSALYASSLSYLPASELKVFLAEREGEIADLDRDEKKQLKKAIKAIESIISKFDENVYEYIHESCTNKDNHMKLKFKNSVKMKEYQLGCFCHDDV